MNEVINESYNNLTDGVSAYRTPIQKAVHEIMQLSRIYDLMKTIDFKEEIYGDVITNLYAEKKDALKNYDKERVKSINEQLKEYKETFAQKKTILLKKILCKGEEFDIRFGYFYGKSYVFNSKFWEQLDPKIMEEFLSEVAVKTGIKECIAKQSKKKRDLLEQFCSDATIILEETPDNLVKVNVENGTIHIDNFGNIELKSHNPLDYLTSQLKFKYDPKAKAPKFEALLNRILPDEKLRNILLEFIGYCMTQGLNKEKCLVAYGATGANGKSTCLNIVVRLLGEENVGSSSLQNLTDSKGYSLAQTAGLLLNACSEFGNINRVDWAKWKQIVSGESIEARSPFGIPFYLKPKYKIWINTNILPHGELTNGFQRRLLLIPFDVSIPPSEQNPNLVDEICKDELPGILNMALTSIKRIISQNGFTQSDVMDKLIDKYMSNMDSVRLFVKDERWNPSSTEKITLKEFTTIYRDYCQAAGHLPVSRNKLSDRLRDIGYDVRESTNGYTYVFASKVFDIGDDDPNESAIDKALKSKFHY